MNSRPIDRQSNALPVALPRHPAQQFSLFSPLILRLLRRCLLEGRGVPPIKWLTRSQCKCYCRSRTKCDETSKRTADRETRTFRWWSRVAGSPWYVRWPRCRRHVVNQSNWQFTEIIRRRAQTGARSDTHDAIRYAAARRLRTRQNQFSGLDEPPHSRF